MGGANGPELATEVLLTVRVSCARDESIIACGAPLGGADRRT
jgi:hypothetical protein